MDKNKLVNAEELREVLWNKKSRPSVLWIRQHTGKDIPAVKVGRLYWYDPIKVRAALQAA